MLPQVRVQLPQDMGERTWGTELLVIDTPQYIGKVMHMRAGCAGGLQKHVEKDEASFLFSGEAWVYTDTGDGTLKRFRWTAGSAIHIPPGSVHKVEAITDCVLMECSTPHFNDRIRLEEQYGRTDTAGLPTTRTDGGVSDPYRAVDSVDHTCACTTVGCVVCGDKFRRLS